MAMTSVSPEEIPLGEETTLTITGTGLGDVDGVIIGGGVLYQDEPTTVSATTVTVELVLAGAGDDASQPGLFNIELLEGEDSVASLEGAITVTGNANEDPTGPGEAIGVDSGRYLQELTEQTDDPWLLRENL